MLPALARHQQQHRPDAKDKTMTLVATQKDPAKAAPDSTCSDTAEPESRGGSGSVLRLHYYAGILAGPLLLVAALTGGVQARTRPDKRSTPKQLHVSGVAQPLPLHAGAGRHGCLGQHRSGRGPSRAWRFRRGSEFGVFEGVRFEAFGVGSVYGYHPCVDGGPVAACSAGIHPC